MGIRFLQLVAKRPDRGGILLVDDDPHLRGGLRVILSEGGFENFDRIFEAGDGETARQLAFRHHPEIVILDYRMPGMDGEAVARGLRAMLRDARIIMFSGVPPTEAAAADTFIEKPHIEELLRAVADAQTPAGPPPDLRVVQGEDEPATRTGS